jgi:hypothetical protein
MEQDEVDLHYSTQNGTSLEGLAQMLRGCSPDDQTLAKRQASSLTLGSLQGTFLNPIKKKLKLEAGLQDGYELENSLGKSQSSNASLVKQEEPGPYPNCEFEGSHNNTSNQEISEKRSSGQSHSKNDSSQTEDPDNLYPSSDGSYSTVKPQTLC